SLAILAACLLAIGWAWFALLVTVWMRDEPLALDLTVFGLMYELRNPLADRLMAGLASIGDWEVLLPAAGLALAWLLWRRRWSAAWCGPRGCRTWWRCRCRRPRPAASASPRCR